MSSKPNLLALAGLAGLACLTACGFTPLYGNNGAAAVSQQMEEVNVAIIPDRPGQLLRQSLQNQLQLNGAPTQELYVLTVSYHIEQADIGIQQDTSATRNRFTASATWELAPIGSPTAPLTQGQASTEDAANIIDQQYFALTLETSTINQQLADEIASQIASQVAAYFKTHPNAG